MALSIKNPEVDRLARELAAQTGETMTEAILQSLRERLARTRKDQKTDDLLAEMRRISRTCARLPVLDDRDPDEILGYGEDGLPH
ncbi:MAG: type II toxin-antitoxin system VapB family antitoxin [Hyphomicrobiales bacterium]|nr:type II toxin-antitoxin system VapB family antitoxin [Hyphomicrobiales bacterium]MCP5373382.1 type II toxin-antitoxin system VapB family antitoxin [Hyphomicrobiales bacterium]